MKKTILTFLMLVACTALAGQDPAADEIAAVAKAVRGYNMHTLPEKIRTLAGAGEAFYEAHKGDERHYAQLASLRADIVAARQRTRDFEKGLAYAEALYGDEKAPFGGRIVAADFLVARLLDGDKTATERADAIYAGLARLPDVEEKHRLVLVGKRAGLFTRRGDQAGAIAFIEREGAAFKGSEAHLAKTVRPQLAAEVARIYHDFCDYPGELGFWLKNGDKAKALAVLTGGFVSDVRLAEKLAKEIVDGAAKPGEALTAWTYLLENDRDWAMAHLAKVDDGTPAAQKALAQKLAASCARANVLNVFGVNAPAYHGNWPLMARMWELYLPRARATGLPVAFDASRYAAVAYAALGDRAKARAAAEAGLGNAKLKPGEAYELKLMAAILELEGADEEVLFKALCAAEEKLSGGLDANDRKKDFGHAATVAVLLRDEPRARAAARFVRTFLDPTQEKRVYTVRYSTRQVTGAGDWDGLSVVPEESDYSRKFGTKELAFMLTDVATGDRGSAAEAGEKSRKYPTTLRAVADDWGLHFAFTFYDKRARQFESGELGAGSFENYIAPGENTPYLCFLNRVLKNPVLNVMNTSYDMPGHRYVDFDDPNQVRCDTLYLDDRIVVYTAFSWDVFADHIPVDGAEWDFESIYWGPSPCAWNGTKTIHGRSTWGKLRFELGEAARTRILRQQLYEAVVAYGQEKTAKGPKGFRGAQGGILDFWKDETYGDPEFYANVLKPRIDELDAVAARVKVAMTDEEVREIGERYFRHFRDLRLTVARLRAEYAAKALTVVPPTALSKEWSNLFARDLSNCEMTDGQWVFDDEGCLMPLGDSPIFTRGWYENFELEVVYAIGPKGNSGCIIYTTEYPSAKIEVQMRDDTDTERQKNQLPHKFSGALYGHHGAFAKAAKAPNEWNTLLIRADGKRVRVLLNGVETANADLSQFTSDKVNPDGTEVPSYMLGQVPLSRIPTTGSIGFQGRHGAPESAVRIKSARIRGL